MKRPARRHRLVSSLRPDKGWRSSVNEVAKIVVGVLIAVGLGAVASEISWQVEVGKARNAIALELGETVGQADERMKVAPCVERRLDELVVIIEASAATERTPPLGDIAMPPFRTWNRGLWDSAVSSQAAAHFPREEAGALTGLNEFVSLMQETSRRELEVWTKLYGLVGPGRAITADEIVSMRQAIGDARLMHRTMAMAAIRSSQMAKAWELEYNFAVADDYRNRELTAFAMCQPIGREVPSSYGQAPMQGVLARAAENPITRTSSGG